MLILAPAVAFAVTDPLRITIMLRPGPANTIKLQHESEYTTLAPHKKNSERCVARIPDVKA